MWQINKKLIIKERAHEFKAALKKKDNENWLNDENSVSSSSRQEITFKEVKKLHRFENNLKEIKNPTYRISLRKLRLGAHILRIQTGKSKTSAQQ